MKRRIGLRTVVAALVFATVAPLGALAAWGMYRSWGRASAFVDRQNVSTARAISTAVDSEIENTARALDVLVALHALDTPPDLPEFERLANRLIPSQQNWSALLLATADGTVIDGVPDAADGGERVGDLGWAQATAAQQQRTVSNMFTLSGERGHYVMIGVPVVRSGRVTHVIGARVRSDGLSTLLRRQQSPPNGVVALLDGSNRIVARTKEEGEYIGTLATPAFIDQLAQANEGAWRGTTRDGVVNYAAYSKSSTGLTVALGIPQDEIDAPLRRILWGLIGAWVVVLAGGAALGLLLGGRIVRALGSASRASMALARGDTIAPPSSHIAEIDDLAAGLRQAAATVQARNRERDEASRLKDEFLMTVSHELRTPLTAILGWSRMLSTGEIRDVQRPRAMEAIERNATALHQLVNDLLDVSRIVSGKLRLDVEPVALGKTIAAAVDAIRPAAEAKSIEIATTVDLGGRWVNGDPSRLQQVIWNLLSNAVRFTPNGGRIDVNVARAGDDIEISVADTGSGVEPGFLPYVFDRFRQGAAGTTRAHGGLGLGLAIVRHLTELHGGTVHAENNTASPGATFRVRLPARAATLGRTDGVAAMDAAAQRPANRARLDDLDVLVVDDDLHARELFTTILENAGARVKAAASAEDALVILDGWLPDALVSDIEMPNVDGYSLIERLRSRQNGTPLVAIAVTAHVSPSDRSHAIDAGYQCHLSKPIEPAELVAVVATLTARG